MNSITEKLLSMQDLQYKAFHSALIPNVDENTIIGIRIPELRKFAKTINKEKAEVFMSCLPHKYYEENNLHAFLIERIDDYSECIKALDAFLPYVDNWATCDSMRPKVFRKHLSELLEKIKIWISSNDTYTVRFGLEMLMCFYLDSEFEPEILEIAKEVKSEEYYINMMLAWFFATALAKQYDSALPYLTEHKLSVWVHNKTIQKSIESNRVTDRQKKYLKTLKRR